MFKVIWTKRAKNELRKIDGNAAKQFKKKFEEIAPIADEYKHEGLVGGKLKGYKKLRQGKWRAVYDYDKGRKVLEIIAVGHRDKIYREFGKSVEDMTTEEFMKMLQMERESALENAHLLFRL